MKGKQLAAYNSSFQYPLEGDPERVVQSQQRFRSFSSPKLPWHEDQLYLFSTERFDHASDVQAPIHQQQKNLENFQHERELRKSTSR
jgi:hypothetical protein